MKFDNSQSAIKIHMLKMLLALFMAILIALNYTAPFFFRPLNAIGIPQWAVTVFAVTMYLAFFLFHILRRSSYVYYNDEGSKIIIRFYVLRLFWSKKNSFEIAKGQLVDVKERVSLLGLRREVVLTQWSGSQLARYPGFSITALPPDLRDKLLTALRAHLPA